MQQRKTNPLPVLLPNQFDDELSPLLASLQNLRVLASSLAGYGVTSLEELLAMEEKQAIEILEKLKWSQGVTPQMIFNVSYVNSTCIEIVQSTRCGSVCKPNNKISAFVDRKPHASAPREAAVQLPPTHTSPPRVQHV